MQFSTWSLLLLLSLSAGLLASARFCYLQWPSATLAVSLGLIAWLYTWLMILGLSVQGLPRNAAIILGGVFIGIVAMYLFRSSPSPLATVVGFVTMWVLHFLARQFGQPIGRWAGFQRK